MADINDELERTAQALQRLNSVLDPYTEIEKDALDLAKEHAKADKERVEAIKKHTKEIVTTTFNTVSAVSKGNSSFNALNPVISTTTNLLGSLASTIPIFGNALKGLSQAAGEAAKLMVDQFQIGYTAYKDLSDIGLTQNFEQMSYTAASLELRFEDVGKALQNYSKDIATFGGTTTEGLKRFTAVAKQLADTRDSFRNLGISAEEFTTFQAKYFSEQTRRGLIQGKTDKDLAEGTARYIDELDQLSKLTGLSRKDLQSQRDSIQSQTKFASKIADLAPEIGDAATELSLILKTKGGEALQEGFNDIFTAGVANTEAAKALEIQAGGRATAIINNFSRGLITRQEAEDQLRTAISGNVKNFTQIGAIIGDTSIATKGLGQAIKFANSAQPTAEQIRREQDARKKNQLGQNAQTAALANTDRQLYQTGIVIQQLATSSEGAAKAMDLMSSSIEDLALFISEKITKTELPSYLKSRKEERNSLEKEGKIRKDLQDTIEKEKKYSNVPLLGSYYTSKRQGLEKDLTSQQQQTQTAKLSSEVQKYGLDKFTGFEGLRIKSEESIRGGKADTAAISLAHQVQKALGDDLVRFTAFNDRYHQENSPESLHTKGKAFDFTIRDPLNSEKIASQIRGMDGVAKVIDEYKNPSPNSTGGHIHVEVRRFGGPVASGKQYLVGEEGPEIITPNTSGTVTPNSVFDGGFKILGDKLDRVAELLNDGNTTRKKQLQRAMS